MQQRLYHYLCTNCLRCRTHRSCCPSLSLLLTLSSPKSAYRYSSHGPIRQPPSAANAPSANLPAPMLLLLLLGFERRIYIASADQTANHSRRRLSVYGARERTNEGLSLYVLYSSSCHSNNKHAIGHNRRCCCCCCCCCI